MLPPPPVSWQVCRFMLCVSTAWKYVRVCVCVRTSVSNWAAHDFSQMESLPFVFRPITASRWPHTLPEARPTHLHSKHSRPHFPSSLLTSFLLPLFLSSHLPLLCPAVSRKSVQNLFNSTWLCTRADVQKCVHAYVHTGRRTWNRCLDDEGPSWVWTDDPLLWPFPSKQTIAWLCGKERRKHMSLSVALWLTLDIPTLCLYTSLKTADNVDKQLIWLFYRRRKVKISSKLKWRWCNC